MVNAREHGSVKEVCRWKVPQQGYVKCNSDIEVFRNEGCATVDLILRGDAGEFIVAKTCKLEGLGSIRELEAIRVLEAMTWVRIA